MLACCLREVLGLGKSACTRSIYTVFADAQEMIFEVSCSCLEIYNERIADLLASGATTGGNVSISNDVDSAPSTPRGSFAGGWGAFAAFVARVLGLQHSAQTPLQR